MDLHKITGFAALLVFLFSAGSVMAGDYATDSGDKFTRGLANTATGLGEIPKNIGNESRDQNALIGATYGTAKGAAHAIGRTAVGIFDLSTFFVPTDEYVHSTYVWDNTGSETTYGSRY